MIFFAFDRVKCWFFFFIGISIVTKTEHSNICHRDTDIFSKKACIDFKCIFSALCTIKTPLASASVPMRIQTTHTRTTLNLSVQSLSIRYYASLRNYCSRCFLTSQHLVGIFFWFSAQIKNEILSNWITGCKISHATDFESLAEAQSSNLNN